MQLGLLYCTSRFIEKGNSYNRPSRLHIFFFSILSCIIYLLSFILKGYKNHVCRNCICLYLKIVTYARDRIRASLSDLTLYHHSCKNQTSDCSSTRCRHFLVRYKVSNRNLKCSKLHLQYSEA